MTLYNLKNGQNATIVSIDESLYIKNRLEKLGLFKGVKVCALRKAIFKGAIQIRLRNFSLALRKDIAEKIIVKI